MPCFCKETSLSTMTPTARLDVNAVPPQLKQLLALLDLEPIEGPRLDEQIGEILPEEGPGWISATIGAQVPDVRLPSVFPPGGGAMMEAVMRLSAAATLFPLGDPLKLLAELQQAALSFEANFAPQFATILSIPKPGLANMALAAQLTLALQAKGVCPLTLASVNLSANFSNSMPRTQAAIAFAMNMGNVHIPPFALPSAQLVLAQKLAGLTSLGDAAAASGLPPLSSPGFKSALKAQLQMLAAMPIPQISIPPDLLGTLANLDVILEAFGPDALTPSGIARVNAMLNFMAQIRLPMPYAALSLSESLSVTPPFEDVQRGMDTAMSAGASLSASWSTSVTLPPIVGLMEGLGVLAAMLTKGLGTSPFGPCNVCNFPLDAVAASLASVPLPPAPKF